MDFDTDDAAGQFCQASGKKSAAGADLKHRALERDATPEEIAEKLDRPLEDVKKVLGLHESVISTTSK